MSEHGPLHFVQGDKTSQPDKRFRHFTGRGLGIGGPRGDLDHLRPEPPQIRRAGAARARRASGEQEELSRQLSAVLAELQRAQGHAQRLLVRSERRIRFVAVDDIDWIEAADNYARLHVGAERHLIRETMGGLEARLDPARFARSHRSTIVSLARIRELQPTFNGEYAVFLHSGVKLTLSRGYRDAPRARLGTDW